MMILEHFQLRRPPFEAVADSRFYYPTPCCEQALALAHYAARNSGEAALVCGPAGCGKTLVLRTVRRQLPREQFAVVFATDVAGPDAIHRLAGFIPPSLAPPQADAYARLRAAAQSCAVSGRTLVLMLDGGCGPASGVYAILDWLLNLDVADLRASALLTARDVPDDADRLLGVAPLTPLPAGHVQPYLVHRLRRAGHRHGALFEPAAVEAIAAHSQGVPRTIHRIANLAMHTAALAQRAMVTADDVQRAVERLGQLRPPEPVASEARP